ncbi:mannosyltransferase PIG-M [Tamaricihabitans halophyticus]|uniref:Mannosyltransferase PIG-M n=1 Tax=Tamaricihabitans halophyticus TaxID=1262583 RepID=A0A4R2R3H7_9PSEU|nr:hypothetical protein [Tamaricihabitans halophyticus]TCP57382.1 mannosyltransferase PIG-M [Tamaricihabitans halophyticus]
MTAGPVGTAASPGRARLGRWVLAVVVLLCGLTLAAGFLNKNRCTGPWFDDQGRSQPDYQLRSWAQVCYSDIQYLWLGREVNEHVFPYVHGDITADGELTGGAVEYPVLTGMLIWLGATFAQTDAGFLLGSTLLLAPFGLLVAWLLGKLSRWRALVWALGPPLVLYAFHNWDLPAVACVVGAVFLLYRLPRPLEQRASWAAVLLGLGFAVKVYPLLGVLPLALYVLTGGRAGAELARGNRLRPALRVVGAAVGTVVLVNLPFALAGFAGWRASFVFQFAREADVTSNSLWYWAFRPDSEATNEFYPTLVGVLSPVLMVAAFALACLLGWRRSLATGSYPWLPVFAAMLCAFLLLHKVHSPQYALWLLPMFVLLRVHWGWIASYLVADLAMGIGVFRWFYLLQDGTGFGISDGFAAQAVMIGVWGRAALLVALFLVFLRAQPTFAEQPPLPRHIAGSKTGGRGGSEPAH